ncbi:MAG: vWA domain-containing protein [Gordonia amarae]
MATWTKKRFESQPVTEAPPGPLLERLQASLSGSVVLALDVSGSMSGSRLSEAKDGCSRFFDEAIEDGYSVGALLWTTRVEGRADISRSGEDARRLIAGSSAGGGNGVVPALREARDMLMAQNSADRVIAIFGDGDLGHPAEAIRVSAELRAEGIRIITCGLGLGSAEMLAVISSEADAAEAPRTAEQGRIADAIAGMSSGLKRVAK